MAAVIWETTTSLLQTVAKWRPEVSPALVQQYSCLHMVPPTLPICNARPYTVPPLDPGLWPTLHTSGYLQFGCLVQIFPSLPQVPAILRSEMPSGSGNPSHTGTCTSPGPHFSFSGYSPTLCLSVGLTRYPKEPLCGYPGLWLGPVPGEWPGKQVSPTDKQGVHFAGSHNIVPEWQWHADLVGFFRVLHSLPILDLSLAFVNLSVFP